MNANNGAIQLGLLPNMDTPVSQLRQRQRPIKNSVVAQERDLSVRTQAQLLQHISPKVAQAQQSYPDPTTVQSLSEWERSQEFIVNVKGQDVRVNFRAFYFSRNVFGCGVHHFEFFGQSTSPTGYRSDFLQASFTDSWASPTEYGQQRAQELHVDLVKQQRQQQRTTRRKQKNGSTKAKQEAEWLAV